MTLPILRTVVFSMALAAAAGCSTYSATEASFGDSVRNVVTKQQVGVGGPLAEDEPLQQTDGRRIENVTRVHQNSVGNPAAVVGTKDVSGGGQ
jgi:hypothetical protein